MSTPTPSTPRRSMLPSAVLAAGLLLASAVRADQSWDWAYAGSGITASGTLITGDVADAAGFLQITAITGMRNGDPITALQPTGTAIPGNEPFAVDNLIKASGELSGDGFGFATLSGTYANVFFADFTSPPGDLEFSSIPALKVTAELPVSFTLVHSVPEPSTWLLMAIGGLALAWRGRVVPGVRWGTDR